MFATLLGALPRPPLAAPATTDELVAAALEAQVAAGLEPVHDAGQRPDAPSARAWEATAGLTDRAVKQVLEGPYTAALRAAPPAEPELRWRDALDRAAALNAVIRDLVLAGCPLVEIHEPAATGIGADEAARAAFREAHLRLLDGIEGIHATLAITGGDAHLAGIETILAAPYGSLAVDLIAGPDNWSLVTATPGSRGIVCGALSANAGSDDGPELLLWAAGYAASTGGRGLDRVGLATASSLAGLDWSSAVGKMEALGRAVRLAEGPAEELVAGVDPRAVSIRPAGLPPMRPLGSRDPGEAGRPTGPPSDDPT